jgi:hypothetical protein
VTISRRQKSERNYVEAYDSYRPLVYDSANDFGIALCHADLESAAKEA